LSLSNDLNEKMNEEKINKSITGKGNKAPFLNKPVELK
jgi:hypothetical protein